MLPQNGRIIIVDDKMSEAKPLMDILSKKRLPFNYYTGLDTNDFPDDPSENKFRVLFLDLNIFESNRKIKDVISVLSKIIISLVPDNPNPYLLVIWSKKRDEYGEALEEHFRDRLTLKKPAQTIFLHKQNYFDINLDNGEWIPQDNCLEHINADLNKELDKISLLGNLFAWENTVHRNACETLNEFTSFYDIDEKWDKNSKAVMYRLARAFVGNDDIDSLADDHKLAKAFSSINSFLSERLENEVDKFCLGNISGVTDANVSIPDAIIAKINSKLHISAQSSIQNYVEQGNIYFLDNNIYKMLERIIIPKLIQGKFNGAKINVDDILKTTPQLLQLDTTPVCDYSQDKGYVRLIFGVLLPRDFCDNIKNVAYIYKTPNFYIDNLEKFILFDFRFIKTLNREIISSRENPPRLKLRKEICTDIQSQLANQINRPGISNL